MSADWHRLCRGRGLRVDGDRVEVRFADERHHALSVEDSGDAYWLVGVVVRRAAVEELRDGLPLRIWQRNRLTPIVGFRIDERGRLVGEASLPKAGLTADEFRLCLRTVAAECDRFEYLLTGRDVE